MGIDFKEMQHLEIHHWLVVFRPWKIWVRQGASSFFWWTFQNGYQSTKSNWLHQWHQWLREIITNHQLTDATDTPLGSCPARKNTPVLNLTKNPEATDSSNAHLGFIHWKLALAATIFPTSSSQFFSHFARTRKSIPPMNQGILPMFISLPRWKLWGLPLATLGVTSKIFYPIRMGSGQITDVTTNHLFWGKKTDVTSK